jgi:hypothetical protein
MLSQIIKAYTALLRTAYKNRHPRSARTKKFVDRFQDLAGAMDMAVAEDVLRGQTPSIKKGVKTMVKKPAKDTYAKPIKEGKAVNLKPMKPGKKGC